jgi:hypothetical protein
MSKVLLIAIATGKYHSFIEPMIGSAREFFLSGESHDVNFLVFTDNPTLIPDHSDTYTSVWEHRPWPYPTLLRYHAFLSQKDFISGYDYLFYCDADMLFVAPVGDEILVDGLVATIHPGFYNKHINDFSYERNENSTAYIPYGHGENYYAGGFNGGRSADFIEMCKVIKHNIDVDHSKDIIAEWHDESQLNKYFYDVVSPAKKLDPSYCFPEADWAKDLPFDKKLIALDKNHEDMREVWV